MSLGTTIKIKVAEIAAADLAKNCEKGSFGSFPQRVYNATKGYKSAIGIAVLAITTALAQYSPPGYESYLRWTAIAASILTAAGLIEKAYRKQPIFEPWFLEALARVTAWISAGSAITAVLASQHVFDAIFKNECVDDMVIGIFAALTSAAGLLNRLAVASATQPKE